MASGLRQAITEAALALARLSSLSTVLNTARLLCSLLALRRGPDILLLSSHHKAAGYSRATGYRHAHRRPLYTRSCTRYTCTCQPCNAAGQDAHKVQPCSTGRCTLLRRARPVAPSARRWACPPAAAKRTCSPHSSNATCTSTSAASTATSKLSPACCAGPRTGTRSAAVSSRRTLAAGCPAAATRMTVGVLGAPWGGCWDLSAARPGCLGTTRSAAVRRCLTAAAGARGSAGTGTAVAGPPAPSQEGCQPGLRCHAQHCHPALSSARPAGRAACLADTPATPPSPLVPRGRLRSPAAQVSDEPASSDA